jgi:hypothetical protein
MINKNKEFDRQTIIDNKIHKKSITHQVMHLIIIMNINGLQLL